MFRRNDFNIVSGQDFEVRRRDPDGWKKFIVSILALCILAWLGYLLSVSF